MSPIVLIMNMNLLLPCHVVRMPLLSLIFTKMLKLELSNNRSSLRKSSVRHAGAGLDGDGDGAAREMEPKSRNLNQIRRNNNIVSLA